jgi:protein-S-isoprenylcysteine O-methyltransferase Ste14
MSLASSSSAKFLLFLILLLLIDNKASREEEYLKEKFGAEWTEYASKVKKILPFLY